MARGARGSTTAPERTKAARLSLDGKLAALRKLRGEVLSAE